MAAAGRQYEYFEPSTRWIHEDACDTLVFDLPGFMKQDLRVQLTSQRQLRVIGERQLGDNRWDHFLKEFPISSNSDRTKITARFENAKLFIRLPKEITSVPPQNETAEKPAEPAQAKPANEMQNAKNDAIKTAPEIASKARHDKIMSESAYDNTKADGVYRKRPGENDKKEDNQTRHENDQSGKFGLEKYKQAAGDMVPQLRKPSKVVSILLVVCSVMVLGLYVRKLYKSFGASKYE